MTTTRQCARVAGVFYLLNILTILLAIVCFRGIVAARDPVATAGNLLAHESLFRSGIALELLSTACSIAVAVLLYEVLKPVDAAASLLAACFRLTACAVAIVGYVFQLAPLQLLGDARSVSAIKPDELAALGLLLYRLHNPPSDMVIVFFGFHFLLLGFLILRSTFVPRALGVLVGVAGAAGVMFLVPGVARGLFLYFASVGLLAEVSLTLWLLTANVMSPNA